MSCRVPVALAAVLLSAAPAWPQFSPEEAKAAQKDPRAYTLDEKSLKIERVGPTAAPAVIPSPKPAPGEVETLPVLDEIVNIALKLWKVIEANKPVVDIRTQYATALPRGVKGWTDMAGWKPPVGTIYELSAKNGYGMKVINVRYQVLRTYGGSYEGAGKYLTAVTVEPLLVEVGWGYHFALDATIPDSSIVNVGTSADPVAGMIAQLGWRISTPLKDSSGQSVYFLQGDGAFREIAGPFSNQSLEKARAKVAELQDKPQSFE